MDFDQNKDETFLNGRFSTGSLESEGDSKENILNHEQPNKEENQQTQYFDFSPEDSSANVKKGGYSFSNGSNNHREFRLQKRELATYEKEPIASQNHMVKAFLTLGICAIAALLIAFIALLISFVKLSSYQYEQKSGQPISNENRGVLKGQYPSELAPDEAEPDYYNGQVPNAGQNGTGSADYGNYYGELDNSIREDLAFGVEWEDYTYDEDESRVSIDVKYPVITGKMQNLDLINDEILKEKTYFEELYKEYSVYMLEGEQFQAAVEGYVTYMDEELMSIVFSEVVYTDYWSEYSLYCINIDTQNGVILDNQNMIDVNTEFASDFRIRSREQNGSNSMIDYMTEQELMYYLTDSSTIIVFYTPTGLEIGMNYGDGYLTVTYQDYEQYMKKY